MAFVTNMANAKTIFLFFIRLLFKNNAKVQNNIEILLFYS